MTQDVRAAGGMPRISFGVFRPSALQIAGEQATRTCRRGALAVNVG
jgi:hypothetical protein